MRKCCAGGCRSNYKGETETVTCFGFPNDTLKRKAWIQALNVVITEEEITPYMGVCIKHWPVSFETYRKKGHDLPVHPPSMFVTEPSCSGQTVTLDRCISKRKIDYDSRGMSTEKKKKDMDKFENWSEIFNYAKKKKNFTFSEFNNGFHLLCIQGNPPRVIFSIEITK